MSATHSHDYDAVIATLTDYFDGLYYSDTARLRRAMHPHAHYVCATDGSLLKLDMEAYWARVDQRASPASQGAAREDKIVSLEFAGPVTAFARVECAIPPKRFTDLLTLIKLDGRWQIISKVFHYELDPA
ncbi:nuclear transport factor 2 family protein [Lysobacter sp. 1R34A]|uniref:nuclear transport factor 2 family protein n=1 Tax=Lysobacter sp. 1R34A TaxID=3445786 RepID=UPI003EE837D8